MHRALQTPPRDKGWIKGLLYNFATPCQKDFLSVPYFQLYIEVPLLQGRDEPLDLQKTLYIPFLRTHRGERGPSHTGIDESYIFERCL